MIYNRKNTQLSRTLKSVTNILLIGLSGSGKSSIGQQLARRMGFGFFDLDLRIEKTTGLSIARIFSEKGESWFRDKESETLKGLKGIVSHVIALGGGTAEAHENRDIIRNLGVSVWLNPPPGLIAQRLSEDQAELRKRPGLAELTTEPYEAEQKTVLKDVLERQLRQREKAYAIADLEFTDGFASADHAACRIIQMLEDRASRKYSRKRQEKRGGEAELLQSYEAPEGG
ncbi:MAG: AAA family ATPase [Deltaproteobacteria bacterium]|nr:AAA family ATPase [Deltaproteobacteria bacterium]